MDAVPPDAPVPPQRAGAVTTSRLVVPDRALLEHELDALRRDGWLLRGVAVVEGDDGLLWRVHAERPDGDPPAASADATAQPSSAEAASTTSPGGTRRL